MVAMAKLEKFLFDTEFEVDDPDWDKEEAEEPVDPNTLPRYSEYEMQGALEQARQEARAEGHAAGLAEAKASIDAFVANELVTLGKRIERLAVAEEANTDAARHEAAGLAMAIGRRLSGALIEMHPVEYAEAMIVDTLEHLTEALRESRIVVRVAPDLAAPLGEHIAAITAKVAFAGQAVVIGDETLGPGDCRVEWAQGGAEMIHSETDRWVSDAVARYLTSLEEPVEVEEEIEEAPVEAAEETEGAPDEGQNGVKSVGGSKSVRYDETPEEEAPDTGVKSVGGSKSVRYDEPAPEADDAPAADADDTPADAGEEIKTVGGSKSVRYE